MPLAKSIGQVIFKRLAPDMASAASMIRVAAKYGGTYRRTEMLADIRKYTGRAKFQAGIERLSPDSVVPRAWMVETNLNNPEANYRVFGKATVLDLRTGKEDEQVFSFYHNERLSKEQYAREFNEYFSEDSIDPDMEFLSFNQTIMEHNVGKPY